MTDDAAKLCIILIGKQKLLVYEEELVILDYILI
jgi:hypothetical protein